MNSILIRVLNLSLSASWLILTVIVLRAIFKKAPKWFPCALWAIVAIRLILPFSLESVISLVPSSETIPMEIVTMDSPQIDSGFDYINQVINPAIGNAVKTPSDLKVGVGKQTNPGGNPSMAASENGTTPAGEISPSSQEHGQMMIQTVFTVASVIWIVGKVSLLGYAGISAWRLKRKTAASIEIEEGVLECDEVKSPFILGVFRPKIYIPSSISKKTLSYVLAHERAHLARRDQLWKPLGFLILTVYWFNPLCWVAYILLCRDIEMACDEKVIRKMKRQSTAEYSQALLNCSLRRSSISACPLAFGEVGVKQRVKNILNYKKPKYAVVALLIAACIVVTGCFLTSPKKKKSAKAIKITESYSCVPFQAPAKEGYTANIMKVLPDEDGFCISVLYTDRKNGVSLTDIMTVSAMGDIESVLELPGLHLPTAVFPTEYAFMNSDGKAKFLDKNTGKDTKTVTPEFQAEFMAPVSDGFVIAGRREIAKYDQAGNCQASIRTQFPIEKNSYFEENGKSYVIGGEEDGERSFYSVDFTSETASEVATLREMNLATVDPCGNYAFAAQGVYKLDIESKQRTQLIAWNNVDIRPPVKGLEEKTYYPVSDRQFALEYVYGENDSEVLLLSKDEDYQPVVKEVITIGGCMVYQDLPLQWLVYQFNTSHSDYRVVLDEYARFYVGEDEAELRRGRIDLMQYFNDGNTPDIFYGNTFDFEYMGRTGMVADLKPYLDRSPDDLQSLTDAAKNLMVNGQGACYQVFASYWLNGNIGLTRHFPEGSSISATDLYQKSQDLEILEYDSFNAEAAGIVDEALIYRFPDLWGIYDKDKKLSIEDLKKLLDVAIAAQNEYGSGNSGTGTYFPDALRDDLTLLANGIVGDIYSFAERENSLQESISFIGNPGIDGSVHLAHPSCRLAMSTTAADPDKCWELMSGIFTEDVQKIAACSGVGEIPANKFVLKEICDAAMDPKSVSDEVIKSFVGNQPPVSQDIVDDYLQAVATADALYIENRSLMFMVWDEVNSYYTQNRTTDQIAKTLYDRLELYAQENYS